MEGKPGSHKESPDQVDGPTRGSGGEIREEAGTKPKRAYQAGRSRGGRGGSGQNTTQPKARPPPQPRPREYRSSRRELHLGGALKGERGST